MDLRLVDLRSILHGPQSASANGEYAHTPHVATLAALHGYDGGSLPLVVESADGRLPSTVLLHRVAVGSALELARLTEAQERERHLRC